VRFANAEVRRDFTFSQARKAAIRRKLIALFGPESLIDDYDDDGYRTKNRPTQEKIKEVERRPIIASIVKEDSKNTRKPREARLTETSMPERTIDVDTDVFLDWDDDTEEDENEFIEPSDEKVALTGSSKIVDRSKKVVEKPVLNKPSVKLDGLFGPKKAPSEYDPKDQDGEFLEGFEDVKPPDGKH